MDMVAANVEVHRLNKEDVLGDFVRFSWRATRGLTTAAESEARDLVRKMVETGRVTQVEGDKLLATVTMKMQQSRTVFEERVDSSVRKATEKLKAISVKEVARLAEQVGELEKRLEKLQTTKTGR